MFLEISALFFVVFFFWASTKLRPNRPGIKKSESETKEIRYEGRLYDVTNWVGKHPGGRLIEFYVNNDEDASIAIQQFHTRSDKKVSAILQSFKSRPVPENIVEKKDQRLEELTQDFYKLFKELQDEGLFKPSLIYTLLRLSEITFLAALGMGLIIRAESTSVTLLGVFILNIFQARSGFLMHEGGHHSLTGKPGVDRMIEAIVVGLSNGVSGSFWSSAHNRHHAMPQRLDRDVDLNTLPALAYNPAVLKGKLERYNCFMRHQKFLVIFSSWGGKLAAILHLSPDHALKKKKFLELIIFAIHYFGAYQIGFFPYVLLSMLNGPFFSLTFAMSHTHTPVTVEPRHWVEYSTIHTINVEPSWWCDYVMGYLNYQIEHHLFPTMPQFKLRRISGRVRALVEKHGLPYTCVSYGEALQKVFQNLAETSQELDKLAQLEGHHVYWLAPEFF